MQEQAGLYIHIPFCSAICPYCDFAVVVGNADKRRRYVDTLRREVAICKDFGHTFDTIYLGGGTPSLLVAEDLESLLSEVVEVLDCTESARIFLEANPEDVNETDVGLWRQLGIATLSLGVQSFDSAELTFLGRRHSPEHARRSVELALEAGFESVSVDLIYGLPSQTSESWRRSLELAVELGPHHLSCYELEIHERTTFGKKLARGELQELSGDDQADLFLETHRFLNDAGFAGYEVSNFARGDEHRSRHNRKYWYHTPYLGLGVSAHSFDGETRFWNERPLARYEAKVRAGEAPRAGEEKLAPGQRALEAVMLGLRTYAGLDLERLQRGYGVSLIERNGALIERWCRDGLMESDGKSLRPTLRGLAVADALASSLDLAPMI